ncbi:hypothetical protein GCM10009836_40780 [Pseudonocardia ailaonensis]|uniref:Glycosyl transferase n=1 Tax=Pseudonocardia ailaonensis TaxID=367279 RepID=A0ABN2N7M4_9PSEU
MTQTWYPTTPPTPPPPAPAGPSGPPRSGRIARAELLIILGGAVLAGVTMLWNLWNSPDTQYDEVVYTEAAQQVAQGWHLTWTNSPMFVHPPISFLAQAFWLRLTGMAHAPLADAIIAARFFTALMMVFAVLLLGLLAAYLMPAASRRRGLVLVGLVLVLAATDPVLLRYGRLALIEPIALLAGMLTLCLAIRLRDSRPLIYVPVVGLATGLTLLTKEVTAFIIFTPVIHALLAKDKRAVAKTLGGFVWGLGLWLLFPLWAVALGLTTDFVDMKFATFQRLAGAVQITGLNRPGVSLVDSIAGQLSAYATSYVFLLTGAVALLWLLTRAVTGASRWMLSWLVTSYAFAAYIVLIGSLNEQFFVYILPAALVGTVMMGDAAAARLGTKGATAVLGLLAVAAVGTSLVGWVRHYSLDNRGVFAVAEMGNSLPECTTMAVTGDPDKYQYLMNGQTAVMFATGEGAQAHGVHLFVLSDKDVASGFGDATTELTGWVRSHGELVASYDTFTYNGLEVWRTPFDSYDPLADTEPYPNGTFVITDDNRCGGFPVTNGPGGNFTDGVEALGGRAVVGAPMTSVWAGTQVFTGAVLSADPGGVVTAKPVVTALSVTPEYRKANLPPVGGNTRPSDPLITAYAQKVGAALGAPIGPVSTMEDGWVRQAFAGGVVEHGPDAKTVRLAPIGQLALDSGIVKPSLQARTPLAAPPLPSNLGPPQPTSVQPFVTALLAGLALYIAIPVVAFEISRLVRRPVPKGRRP